MYSVIFGNEWELAVRVSMGLRMIWEESWELKWEWECWYGNGGEFPCTSATVVWLCGMSGARCD